MKMLIPRALYDLYTEEALYNALRARIPELPAFVEGSYYMTEEAKAAVKALGPHGQAEKVYEAFEEVHEGVRVSLPAQNLLLSEDFRYNLSDLLELWLAGYEVFDALAHKLAPWLEAAGFELGCADYLTPYKTQLEWVESIDPEHLSLLTGIYFEKRRENAARLGIADEGNLRDYIGEMRNDVFGVVYGASCPAHRNARRMFSKRLYHNYDAAVFVHTVTRQVLRANGGKAPIYW